MISGGAKSCVDRVVPRKETDTHFSELLIELKVVLRVPPRPFTAAMIASEIPAAISPYSIAVAPDSSDKNFEKMRFKSASWGCVVSIQHGEATGNDLKVHKSSRNNFNRMLSVASAVHVDEHDAKHG